MARRTTSSPQHLHTAGNAVMNVPAPMALSMWYHGNAQGNFTYWVSKLLLAGEHPSWGFSTNGSGALRFLIGHGLSGGEVKSSPAVAQGTAYDDAWHHILGYYDGTDIGLYFDGADQGVSNNPGLTIGYDDTKELYLFSFDGSILFSTGELGQIVLWSAIPSPAEIAALAAGAPPEIVRGRSIAAMWDLNGMEPEIGKVGLRHLTNSGTTAEPTHFPAKLKFPDQGD